jgi:hypothetical protein
MFAPYTPLHGCVGKEVTARLAGETFTGILAGLYYLSNTPVIVITPMAGGGAEQHIPVVNAVVTVKP